jgi:lysophospholipase L1-like esterase
MKEWLEQIQLHNVAVLEESPLSRGWQLCRFPREVRHALGERGRFISEEATGCELRFVTTAANVRVTLLLPEQDGEIAVYKGGLVHSMHRLQAGVPRTLHLEEPPRLQTMPRERLLTSGFAPEVWRIIFGRSTGVVLGLNTFGHSVRPPKREETPGFRWLAYGSSITHGLTTYPLSYIDQAARRLQADVMNKGMSGSCLCEREMANYLAAQDDWDMMTLELGVNMRDHFSPEAFAERASHMLERLIGHHPEKPIVLITVYPNFATETDTLAGEREQRYNEILRQLAARRQHPHLYLLEGAEIMKDYETLSCDLIHPGSYGHMLMGQRLAELLRPIMLPYLSVM